VTFPQVAAFASSANGSPNPTRQIAGQNTNLVRSGHYIEYDEKNDEVMIANAFAQAILFFRGGVDGDEAPIRIIMGPHTQIQSPDFGLAIDNVNDEVYVTEHTRVLVFPRKANGDVAPIRILEGPKTELDNMWGTASVRGIGVDPIHNVIVITGYFQNRGHVLIFDRTASGNTAPIRKITGPKSGIQGASYSMRVYPPKGWLFTQAMGGIGVWSVFDSGEIPPRYVLLADRSGREEVDETLAGGGQLGGGEGGLGSRFTFNPKTGELFNNSGDEVEVFSFPEIF
jgi:hypothetical protein